MTPRPPFVSGLAGGETRSPRVADPAGLTLLRAARGWAAAQAAEAKPRTFARFDGIERIPVDLDAVATVEACEAFVRLADGILSDPLLAQRAAQLVRGR